MTDFRDAAPVWLRFMMIFAAVAILAGWPGLASGQPRSGQTAGFDTRLLKVADGQCIQAVSRVQGDMLVNHCNECRNAQIQHQRRGSGFPITREFRVPGKGKMELSYKGSGKTTVVADTPCDGPSQPTAGDVKDCAKITTRKNGEPALVNACPVCRGVIVERVASSGRHDQQTFTLLPRTMLPLPLRGAAGIKIVRELPCKK